MKKIIVPVDFSPAASNAALFAGELAAFYNAEIWLYHTYETPVAISEFAYPLFDTNTHQPKNTCNHSYQGRNEFVAGWLN